MSSLVRHWDKGEGVWLSGDRTDEVQYVTFALRWAISSKEIRTMRIYTDEEIWAEVLNMVADGYEITVEQMMKIQKDYDSETDYHLAKLNDDDYKESIIMRAREWVEDGDWEEEHALGESVTCALYDYWAENSGEYSV